MVVELLQETRSSKLVSASSEWYLLPRYDRLASSVWLKDMMHVFGVSRSQISYVGTDLARFLYDCYHSKLLWDHRGLSLNQLRKYARAIDETVFVGVSIKIVVLLYTN